MHKFKTIFLVGSSVIVGGCISDSMPSLQTDKTSPSYETTGSIQPNATLAQTKNTQYNAWQKAYNAYDKKASAYWDDVAAKRRLRNKKRAAGQAIALSDYVLSQPPQYDGPAKPLTNKPVTRPKTSIPGTQDFMAASKKIYGFTPERPTDEAEFMRAYAEAAQRVGLTRNQLVSIYAFETGGDGTHDLQSGMIKGRANARPLSTAIGYNQLVATASVSLMWEYGNDIAKELKARAAQKNGANKKRLLSKAAVVDTMIKQAKTVPHKWSEQAKLAKTEAGLGMHAMTMDKDVGPLLQIHKLQTSLMFLKRKGVTRQLSGAELEMLNLTGDGNGYDMVTMPENFRNQVPTSNFFLRLGYERNPVARRNNTVAQLIKATEDKMQINMKKDGAQLLNRVFYSNNLVQN
ncbi:hypothetical protein [Bartonella tamiae]|uniref:Uncharacterized protein n=1 Tax=Bartonella tamiae Th239 TaxID=1094558 RepID=J1JUR0_9HYPH|nr:hypothetical protein [Bartonella tamiae]EJF88697.1 hypothetical protein ME5_01248 [Bartonella tamiae Th239]EJF95053.1 hypothetical protein MEG_00634 [Bartonella tamiae Th307]